jgi:hypothetical protein
LKLARGEFRSSLSETLQPVADWTSTKDPGKAGSFMATASTSEELIHAVAAEMSAGIQWAVGAWITEIEAALDDPGLTTLGRLRAVQEAVKRYRTAGKPLACRDEFVA